MAKNKVFLVVLLVLLAGCAVLIGCAGEGAGDVSKSRDNSVSKVDNLTEDLPPATPVESTGDGDKENEEKPPNTFIPPFPPLPPPQELGTFPGLDAETERLIKLDYLYNYLPENANKTIEIYITDFFGIYNGNAVVIMEYPGPSIATANVGIVVADIVFRYPDLGCIIQVWNRGEQDGSGRFYDLKEAFDLGFLSLDDVRSINELHREKYSRMYNR